MVDSKVDFFGTQIEVFSFSGEKTTGLEDTRLSHGLEAIIHQTHYRNSISSGTDCRTCERFHLAGLKEAVKVVTNKREGTCHNITFLPAAKPSGTLLCIWQVALLEQLLDPWFPHRSS